jgi:hypothetical protein
MASFSFSIHPLEEALGFKSLLELGEPVYSIATIAYTFPFVCPLSLD